MKTVVDDRHAARARDPSGEARVETVDLRRRVVEPRQAPALRPAVHLPLDESRRAAEIAEPARIGIEHV